MLLRARNEGGFFVEKSAGTKWYVRRCAIGTLVCLGVYLLLLALCALLTVRGIVGEGMTEKAAWLCAALAAFAGAALCGSRTVRRGTMMALCGACFCAAVLVWGIPAGRTLVTAYVLRFALAAAAGTLGAYLLTGGTKKGKRKKRGRHARR